MIRPENFFNISEKTCSVTGHRNVKKDLDLDKLKGAFLSLILVR